MGTGDWFGRLQTNKCENAGEIKEMCQLALSATLLIRSSEKLIKMRESSEILAAFSRC